MTLGDEVGPERLALLSCIRDEGMRSQEAA